MSRNSGLIAHFCRLAIRFSTLYPEQPIVTPPFGRTRSNAGPPDANRGRGLNLSFLASQILRACMVEPT
jgi:hypothetical protein